MDRESLYKQLNIPFDSDKSEVPSQKPELPPQFDTAEEMQNWAHVETLNDFKDKGIAESDAAQLVKMLNDLPQFTVERNTQIVDTIYSILEDESVGPVKAFFAIHSLLTQLMDLPSDIKPKEKTTSVVFSARLVGNVYVDDAQHWIGGWDDDKRRLFSVIGGVGDVFSGSVPKPGDAVMLTDIGDPALPYENDFGVGIVVQSYQGAGSLELSEYMRFNLYRSDIRTSFTSEDVKHIMGLSSIVWDMQDDPDFEHTAFEAVTVLRIA